MSQAALDLELKEAKEVEIRCHCLEAKTLNCLSDIVYLDRLPKPMDSCKKNI